MKDTKVISGFPGTGKSYCFNTETKYSYLDSDSSKFDKSRFPQNYIDHIKENIGKVDIIFVSSYIEVRKALADNNIEFTSVYPKHNLKREYLERYKNRNNDSSFISLLDGKWESWIEDLYTQQYTTRYIRLESNQYMSDIITKIIPQHG